MQVSGDWWDKGGSRVVENGVANVPGRREFIKRFLL
jgi:hypothetical protein